MRQSLAVAAAGLAVLTVACTSPDAAPSADSVAAGNAPPPAAAAAVPAVSIVSPANGDTVSQPFTVRLEATGVEVIAANGLNEPGKGHHHLLVNMDAPSDTLPLPPAPVVIHMGNGATERVLDSLPPGLHRIIAVFAGGNHVPSPAVQRDTIMVIVK